MSWSLTFFHLKVIALTKFIENWDNTFQTFCTYVKLAACCIHVQCIKKGTFQKTWMKEDHNDEVIKVMCFEILGNKTLFNTILEKTIPEVRPLQ